MSVASAGRVFAVKEVRFHFSTKRFLLLGEPPEGERATWTGDRRRNMPHLPDWCFLNVGSFVTGLPEPGFQLWFGVVPWAAWITSRLQLPGKQIFHFTDCSLRPEFPIGPSMDAAEWGP